MLLFLGSVTRPDPVCAAPLEAYFDLERKSEGESNEAAGQGSDKLSSPCPNPFVPKPPRPILHPVKPSSKA